MRYIIFSLLLLLVGNYAKAQYIDGPLSATPGTTCVYTYYGGQPWDGVYWSVGGGSLISGQGTTQITVTWWAQCDPGYLYVEDANGYSAYGDIMISTVVVGNIFPLEVTVSPGQAVPTLTCPQPTRYLEGNSITYHWMSSSNGVDWNELNMEAQTLSPGYISQSTWYQAYVTDGCSYSYTSPMKVTLLPYLNTPGNLTVNTTGIRQIAIQWQDNTAGEDNYELYRSQGNNSNYQLLTTLPTNQTQYLDNSVTGNTVYYYKVKAVSSVNYSLFSNEAAATTGNTPPAISSIPDVALHYNSPLTIAVSGSDVDNEPVQISASGIPAFASFVNFGNGTGEIRINAAGLNNLGTYPIIITATDSHSSTAQVTFNLVVMGNNPPVIQLAGNVIIQENSPQTINLSVTDAESVIGAKWIFPNGLPNFASWTPIDDATGQMIIRPVTGTTGIYTVAVKVEDAQGSWSEQSFTITVIPETLAAGAILYYADKGLLAGDPARGGLCNGVYEYQWQISENPSSGVFEDIFHANGINLMPQLSATSLYYRLKVTCSGADAYSNVINVSSTTPPAVATISNIKTFDFYKPDLSYNDLQQFTPEQESQSTQYLDGLGRLSQIVVRQGSLASGTNPVDLVNLVAYDGSGREALKYLPYAATTADGSFKQQPVQEVQYFYSNPNGVLKGQSESVFYDETKYEPSPLNRVAISLSPGINWGGSNRGKENSYWLNTKDDDVRMWFVDNVANGFGSYRTPAGTAGVYPDGALYKTVTTNEDGKQVAEFRNIDGLVILKKIQLTAPADVISGSAHPGWLCTYYIYDEFNLLRAVVQPRGVEILSQNGWDMNVFNGVVMNEQIFRYEYDRNKRMIRKKTPGIAEVNMVYDAADRLVLTQDGNLREKHQWAYFTYDELNRPVATGLLNDPGYYDNLPYHLQAAENSVAYPDMANYTFEELTHNYYDNYNWAASLPASLKDFNTAYAKDWLFMAGDKAWPYPQPIEASMRTLGLVTGTRSKVLGTNNYLFTVNFYDEKDRLVQTRTQNVTNGVNVSTSQYSFSGQMLITVNKQDNGSSGQNSLVVTKFDYDKLGRIIATQKKVSTSSVNGGSVPYNWTTVSKKEYNALGQLRKKEIGNKPGAGTPLTHQDYEYNIRGWVLSINKDYITGNNNDDYFGLQIGYDKNAVLGTFSPSYSGNLGGILWKSEGDGQKRKYNFSYDNSNRLIDATFTQYVSGSGASAVFDLSEKIDFSVNGLTYDANGNLITMKQNGWKIGGSTTIDDLHYSYFNHDRSNKLSAVTDISTGGTSPFATTPSALGDFADKNSGTDDYGYDRNGNMVTDKNSRINGTTGDVVTSGGGITNNHLNLPEQIRVKDANGNQKGTITYTYDAAGNKLRKVTTDISTPGKTITITTTYIGNAVYESKTTSPGNVPNDDYTDVLQFIAHEEGRIRFEKVSPYACTAQPNRAVYDYFVKDNLGNVRMVLTEQQEEICYKPATIEDNERAKEKELYYINDAQVTDVSNVNGALNYTQFQQKLYQLHGGVPGQRTGLGIVMKVMSGDKVRFAAQSIYTMPVSGSPGQPVQAGLLELLSAMSGSSLTALKGASVADIVGMQGGTAISSFISQHDELPNRPKAYLNYILFDEQFKYVTGDVDPVEENGGYKLHDKFINTPVAVTKNGYLYIYVSNESNMQVFFDNLLVTHIPGPILEESHYYPFGLMMAGISSKALKPGTVKNDIKYNGIKFEDDLGLGIYDAKFRELDPQIGRWWQIDPKIENMEMWSPYASNYDDPIRYSDPLGDEGQVCCQGLLNALTWVGEKLDQVGNSAPVKWINNTINPLTPLTELVSGKSLNSGYTQDKPRLTSAVQLATFAMPAAKAETVLAAETKNIILSQAPKKLVSLDNNVISAAIKEGQKDAVKIAIGSNKPIISMTAAKEFMAFGSKFELKAFMTEIGATISKNGASAAQVAALRAEAAAMKRSLQEYDARILANAMNNNAAVITNDKTFGNFMRAIGWLTWKY